MNLWLFRACLAWCAIINMALLTLSFTVLATRGDWAYKMHSRWFPVSREQFNGTIYHLLTFYKLFIFIFNIVPYLALRIVMLTLKGSEA